VDILCLLIVSCVVRAFVRGGQCLLLSLVKNKWQRDMAFGVLLLVTGRGKAAKLKSDILLEIQMKM